MTELDHAQNQGQPVQRATMGLLWQAAHETGFRPT